LPVGQTESVPRTIDRRARLDDIADAVEAIAAVDGFGAVTFRRLADHLGASTTVVTHLVESRAELLDLVIARAVDRRRAEILDHLGDAAGGDALRALVEWVVLGPGADAHRFWLALVTGAANEPVVRRRLDEFNDWWDALVDTHARRVEGSIDPATIVDMIDVITAGLVVAGVETGEVWSAARRRATLDRLLAPIGL
jgi:AcrR family transcriptional regulator